MELPHDRSHSPLQQRVHDLASACTLVLFALWWGGITFYALVVVPIGTDLIGSTEQGFITQRVTWWHNWLAVAMSGYLSMSAWRRKQLGWWLLAAALVAVTVGLWSVHWQLTSLLDAEEGGVPSSFYAKHAVYLWLTTVEWLIGVVWVVMYAAISGRRGTTGG